MNLSTQFLKEHNLSLEEYDGACGELCDDILHWVDDQKAKILYVKPRLHPEWRYHMVPVINGLVHDGWNPEHILPIKKYLKKVFPEPNLNYRVY